MRHLLFDPDVDKAHTALLIKESSFQEDKLKRHYITPLVTMGIDPATIIAFTLKYDTPKKIKVSTAKEYLESLLKALDTLHVKTIIVADTAYFKILAKVRKAEPHLGYIMPCLIEGYEHMNVIYTINHSALFFNPAQESKITQSLEAYASAQGSSYTPPGTGIIKSEYYPDTVQDILHAIDDLHNYPMITCDIEGFSLRFEKTKIGTISFAWNQHEGMAFGLAYSELSDPDRSVITEHLARFFEDYKGLVWFHNALFDVKVMVFELYMKDSIDYRGMRHGLKVFDNVQDTMLITYLAINSTEDTPLGLKPNSAEYTGNYAKEDIKDITKIPLPELLTYNLIDSLATWYVLHKYMPTVIKDKQLPVYEDVFRPSLRTLLHMMLHGLPMDPERVEEVKQTLEALEETAMNNIRNLPLIKTFEFRILQLGAMREANSKLKKKIKSIDDFRSIKFNPGSTKQKQQLLYEYLGFEVIDYTKEKQPATGAKTIIKLAAHATEPDHKILLDSLVELSKVQIILQNFISNFQEMAFLREDGTTWLNGELVLGGTQSGRLASRNPNMQNIPSGSTYAKLIKSCFVAPEGWLIAGADFSALNISGAIVA